MFSCFSKKTPIKHHDLKSKPLPKILLKINNTDLTFDPIQGGFNMENLINDNNNYNYSSQEELELQKQLNNKTERINLFKRKIEELDKKLKLMEKIAHQDQEEYMIYEDLYSDSIKKISQY